MSTTLTGLTSAEIAELLAVKPFQGRQIFKWLYQKKVFDFEAMTDLSKPLRSTLKTAYAGHTLELVEMQVCARTGTKKALLRLHDGESVESVLIRDHDRVTLCVSSQVGCALKCDFCATGLAGFTRNLDCAEIIEQVLFLLAGEPMGDRTPNIVFMGMGEPFRNYDTVMKTIHLMMDKEGLGIGARKITISTSGLAPQIRKLAAEPLQFRLALSLHGATDAVRSRIMPVNRKYPLKELIAACDYYQEKKGRMITFEYILIAGVNDGLDQVKPLAELAHRLHAKVNLIPYNQVEGLAWERPAE
ncbi:MAG: 23S rRNA (adenine(2503)-C(2))-methyltransferase RlmN, partial [Pedosphaera parvula]|nr:23S rRNA (adenine(2503)-C(2))-methyltransferase RlmN [Pedosphaera parvula]